MELFAFPGENRTREEHEKRQCVIGSVWGVGRGAGFGNQTAGRGTLGLSPAI